MGDIMKRLIIFTLAIFSLITYQPLLSNAYYEDKLPVEEIVTKISPSDLINNLKVEYNNEDIIGYISIVDTNISEPIVKKNNNSYYLKHNLYKEYDIKGSIFLDYRVNFNDKKILIYGHNSKQLDIPFKELENYYNKEYASSHRQIKVLTEESIKTYIIFSVYVEKEDYQYMNVNIKQEDWLKHLNYLKDKSWYDLDIQLDEESKILILQTCSFHKDYSEYKNKYIVIVAKEDI